MDKVETERKRGRRPGDAHTRRSDVVRALAELESTGVPFSMADLAERAGISRATLYRDAGLRDLIGSRGDSPAARPVDAKMVGRLEHELETLRAERRTLRREVREATRRISELVEKCAQLEKGKSEQASAAPGSTGPMGTTDADRLRREAYAEGFTAGARTATQRGAGGGRTGMGVSGLSLAAARLPRATVLEARRTLARALHPDLFANDPVAALLATEILKQLNNLAEK